MNQILENSEKRGFGLDFGPFGLNLGGQFFFSKVWLHQSLGIIDSCHNVQYQQKNNDQILRKLFRIKENNVTSTNPFLLLATHFAYYPVRIILQFNYM